MGLSRLYPLFLVLAGCVAAYLILSPYRPVDFVRDDGVTVSLPGPTRLNHTSDTWDYLQLGRRLQEGKGFTSLFTYVPHLTETSAVASGGEISFPLLWRQPGFPVLVAAAFFLAGGPDPVALLWLAALAIVLLPLTTYFLGLRFLEPEGAAMAGLWALLSPLASSVSSPLVATVWFSALLPLVVLVLLSARRFWTWIPAGILVGLAGLLRLETVLLLPALGILFWTARTGRRVLGTLVVLVTALLVMLPWGLRTAEITGDASYNNTSLIYHDTDTFPGWNSSRTLAVRDLSPVGFVLDHPGEVARKTVKNTGRFLRDLLLLPTPLLAPLLWLGVLRGSRSRERRAFNLAGVAAVLTLIVVLAPMEYAPRFLAPLVPLMCVGAALGISEFPRYRGRLVLAATVVSVLGFTMALTDRKENGTAALAAADLRTLMADSTTAIRDPDTVLLSDAPTIYAWIWKRPAVWMPVAEDVERVREMLPGSVAWFTRAGGRGDSLSEFLLAGYLSRGGMASAAGPPLAVTWPGPAGGRR